ncbi:tyrosine-type recombinase/integrase [Nitrosovibrio tenuis]|uniref:Site-specific recombinase XerD n=1 Tax=Nitrosovibrio tenuis TaxID=1233 RepID=A0A1H7P3X6_9PROT|nr:site-specific integrase [Nitrosovibrio tenuis]SEL30522.1 Site-specific recombinase XerD [Nitrosovibrio tenuis]
MGKLSDVQIRSWIKAGERFEGKGDGDGLYLAYRKEFAVPRWLFRYRFAGKSRSMGIGTYGDLSLAGARKTIKELRARVALGHDVAGEKQERKRVAVAKIEAEKNALSVGQLADEYFERMIVGHWKHPNIVRSRIERDIKPNIGKLAVQDVKPMHIDVMLQTIVKRGAPTTANDVLRWVRRMFDYAMKRHMVEYNPAVAFNVSDAGGKEEARKRWLTRDELVRLFEAMRNAKGFTVENFLTVKLLLLLAVRKQELTAAKAAEFDLDKAVWYLPAERTKTSAAIDIPLSKPAVECLRKLIALGCSSDYLLPARKRQERMLPHIHENTLNVAMSKAKPQLKDLENFTIHDFRRTARTHLAALGVDSHIAERCLNHKIEGVEGIYNRHDYFPERREALAKWASFLDACEAGKDWNVVPLREKQKTA